MNVLENAAPVKQKLIFEVASITTNIPLIYHSLSETAT
jgi:hypothetical protein